MCGHCSSCTGSPSQGPPVVAPHDSCIALLALAPLPSLPPSGPLLLTTALRSAHAPLLLTTSPLPSDQH